MLIYIPRLKYAVRIWGKDGEMKECRGARKNEATCDKRVLVNTDICFCVLSCSEPLQISIRVQTNKVCYYIKDVLTTEASA